MKDTLFVYYSLEGNTEFVAETAATAAEMDLEKLIPDKEPPKTGAGKYIWGGKSVVFKEKPKLYPMKYPVERYPNIILGFPVWASCYPPAIATFINENDLTGKKLYVVMCSAGGETDKAYKKLEEKLPGCTILDRLSLIDPAKDKDANTKPIIDFIKKNFGSKE